MRTVWNLSRERKSCNRGTGADVVMLDKPGAAAGAESIACGVACNSYVHPAMDELMARSANVRESNAQNLHSHPVGPAWPWPAGFHESKMIVMKKLNADAEGVFWWDP